MPWRWTPIWYGFAVWPFALLMALPVAINSAESLTLLALTILVTSLLLTAWLSRVRLPSLRVVVALISGAVVAQFSVMIAGVPVLVEMLLSDLGLNITDRISRLIDQAWMAAFAMLFAALIVLSARAILRRDRPRHPRLVIVGATLGIVLLVVMSAVNLVDSVAELAYALIGESLAGTEVVVYFALPAALAVASAVLSLDLHAIARWSNKRIKLTASR